MPVAKLWPQQAWLMFVLRENNQLSMQIFWRMCHLKIAMKDYINFFLLILVTLILGLWLASEERRNDKLQAEIAMLRFNNEKLIDQLGQCKRTNHQLRKGEID